MKNPFPNVDWRKIAIEILSVIFAVTLALLLNEWRNNFNQERLLQKAQQNLQEEMNHNREELQTKAELHQAQLKQLIALQDSVGQLTLPFFEYEIGVGILNIKKAAWESIILTDVVNQLEFSELSSFSELYRGFDLIDQLQSSYLREVFSLEFSKVENSDQALLVTKNHLTQMAAWETELLEELNKFR